METRQSPNNKPLSREGCLALVTAGDDPRRFAEGLEADVEFGEVTEWPIVLDLKSSRKICRFR